MNSELIDLLEEQDLLYTRQEALKEAVAHLLASVNAAHGFMTAHRL
jgi:hypothetical protein